MLISESMLLEYLNVFQYIYFINMKKILKNCLKTLYSSFNMNLINIVNTITIEDLTHLQVQQDLNITKQCEIMEKILNDGYLNKKVEKIKLMVLNHFSHKINPFETDTFVRQIIQENNEKIIGSKIIKTGEYIYERFFENNQNIDSFIAIAATKEIIEKLFHSRHSIYLAPALSYAVIKHVLSTTS